MMLVIFMDDSHKLFRQARSLLMRVSSEEKARSRERILTAAGRLFRERGVQGTSVGEIMAAAGMTHGGFYRHFADKDALLAAALTQAFERFAEPLSADSDAATAVEAFRALYLSNDHLATPGEGCPAVALGPDIARSDVTVRKAFSAGVSRMIAGLSRGKTGAADPRTDALRDLSMMVGALVLARAADGALATELLHACAAPAVLNPDQ
jgi:TetR/AcrR family transcriptional repressor of nem operon